MTRSDPRSGPGPVGPFSAARRDGQTPADRLRARAATLRAIRDFFRVRGVLEVDTPLLGAASQDPGIAALPVPGAAPGGEARYLQSSPEYALKRLLAEGVGDLYQLGPVFRAGESGPWHDVEFTLLEWYRVGWPASMLRAEVEELVAEVMGGAGILRTLTYQDAFLQYAGVDPLSDGTDALVAAAENRIAGLDLRGSDGALGDLRGAALDALLSHAITPLLGQGEWTWLIDFPAGQAALATVDEEDPRVAHRFELFIEGLEIANGYRELTDADEQRRRFEAEQAARRFAGQPVHEVDEAFLSALDRVPACSGVALGVDRLLAVAVGARSLDDVRPFRIG